jgi:hypothetical protein
MRVWIVILLVASTATASRAESSHYADIDRILTIERWYHEECIVWAIQTSRVVVYEKRGQAPRRVLFVGAISPTDQSAIRKEISSLPKDAFGFHHSGGYSTHPPLMRLHFSPDGKWVDDRIEVSGFMPTWVAGLLEAVSKTCRRQGVDYPAVVASYRSKEKDADQVDVRKISIPEFHGQLKPWWAFWR